MTGFPVSARRNKRKFVPCRVLPFFQQRSRRRRKAKQLKLVPCFAPTSATEAVQLQPKCVNDLSALFKNETSSVHGVPTHFRSGTGAGVQKEN